MNTIQKRMNDLASLISIQSGDPASWDGSNDYMHGMANGMLLAQATLMGIEPDYIEVKHDGEKPGFMYELEKLINRFSRESDSNTPDFILAEYLNTALSNFNSATNARTGWYRGNQPVEKLSTFGVECVMQATDGVVIDPHRTAQYDAEKQAAAKYAAENSIYGGEQVYGSEAHPPETGGEPEAVPHAEGPHPYHDAIELIEGIAAAGKAFFHVLGMNQQPTKLI